MSQMRPLTLPVDLELAITAWIAAGPDASGRHSPGGRAQDVIALAKRALRNLRDGEAEQPPLFV